MKWCCWHWALWGTFVVVTCALFKMGMTHTSTHLFGPSIGAWMGHLTPFLWAYHCIRVTQKSLAGDTPVT